MSAAWPDVVGWLLTTCPGLSGWEQVTVFDGQPDSGDSPTDYCTVGWTTSGDVGGEFSQETSEDGMGVTETGHVLMDVVCQSGNDPTGQVEPLADVRTRCFSLLDALRAVANADPTLGGLLAANADVSLTVQPLNIKNQAGSAQALVVTFGYFTDMWPS